METLIKIQQELKAPKKQFNKFGNYSYRSAEDILEAVKPLCVENNALLTVSDEIIEVNGWVFVKATATFKHGDFEHKVTSSARHAENRKGMDESQVSGSTASYARKYALNGMFCIDDNKDADQQKPEEKTQKKLKKLPDEKFKDAVKFLKDGKSMKELKSFYEIDEETEFKLITASEA